MSGQIKLGNLTNNASMRASYVQQTVIGIRWYDSLRMLLPAALASLIGLGLFADGLQPVGSDFLLTGHLAGDQLNPDAAINGNGGYLVWQDNATDEQGLGISARQISAQLTGILSTFRINSIGAGDQENPTVALLSGGGAAFAWQGGRQGFQRIFGKVLAADGTFQTDDIALSPDSQANAVSPSIAGLSDGSAVICWSATGGDGDMMGVFARLLAPNGSPIGNILQINQTTRYHQRNARIAALSGGGFAVVWISEQQRGPGTVDVFGRIYSSSGEARTGEFRVSTANRTCGNPAICRLSGGGMLAAWSEADLKSSDGNWSLVSRSFDATGAPQSDARLLAQETGRDTIAVRLESIGNSISASWFSAAPNTRTWAVQVRSISADGRSLAETITSLNSAVGSFQSRPLFIGDPNGAALHVWPRFEGIDAGVDLAGQRFAPPALPLSAPDRPLVNAISPSRLSVTWPEMVGLDVVGYEVSFDGAQPTFYTTSYCLSPLFLPATAHSVQLAYRLSDGRVSPPSEATTATTWGEDVNGDGLPDDWQRSFWGEDEGAWPSVSADSDADGADNATEFRTGTNPLDSNSVLRMRIESSSLSPLLTWNTQPGFIYTLEVSSDLKQWRKTGSPRFARGSVDSVPISSDLLRTFYRVTRLR